MGDLLCRRNGFKKKKLAASSSPWKIVYIHQPPYSSSGDGSINWAQWAYQEWGATAVIRGHSHVYERLSVDGFPYFVNGLGGGPRHNFDAPIPGSQVRYRDDYGVMLVESSPDQITFQFVTRGNQIVDRFSIKK
ncbi:MAG: metallophosphoesterase [Chloroflexi bacterium]|nr:metallophosphoesterase [Chloroflexota bacterium]MBU1661176.1 metallophosphoesterase [Chloroflexota bacterium]